MNALKNTLPVKDGRDFGGCHYQRTLATEGADDGHAAYVLFVRLGVGAGASYALKMQTRKVSLPWLQQNAACDVGAISLAMLSSSVRLLRRLRAAA